MLRLAGVKSMSFAFTVREPADVATRSEPATGAARQSVDTRASAPAFWANLIHPVSRTRAPLGSGHEPSLACSHYSERRSSASGLPPASVSPVGGQGPNQLSRAPSVVMIEPDM